MARAAQRAGASGTVSAIRRSGAATQQPEAAILPGSPATIRRWAGRNTATRACSRARLVRWLGQLGARATGLVFDLVFRLGSVSESPFGPGS